MRIDAESLNPRDTYALITSVLIPRPVAWVGTRSTAGVDNLAPFSYFMGVSSRPPLIAISVAQGRSGPKDTARNLLETRVCTVSVASWSQLELLHDTSTALPPEQSEFEAFGVPKAEAERVNAPRVADAKACFEARVHEVMTLPTTQLFVLEVLAYHVDPALLVDGRADPAQLDPVARLGNAYAPLGPARVLPPR